MLPSDTETQPQTTVAPLKNNPTASYSQKCSLKRPLEQNSEREYTKRQKTMIPTKNTEVLNHSTGMWNSFTANQSQITHQLHRIQEPATETLTIVNGTNENVMNSASTIPNGTYASNLLIQTYQTYEKEENLSTVFGRSETLNLDSHTPVIERPNVNVANRIPDFADYGRKIETLATESPVKMSRSKSIAEKKTPKKRFSKCSVPSSQTSIYASKMLFTAEAPIMYQDFDEREVRAVKSTDSNGIEQRSLVQNNTYDIPPNLGTVKQLSGQYSGGVHEKQSMTNGYYSHQDTYPQRPIGRRGEVNYIDHEICSQSFSKMPSAQSNPYNCPYQPLPRQVSKPLHGELTHYYQAHRFQKPTVREKLDSSAEVNHLYQRNHVDIRVNSEHLVNTSPYTTSSYSNYGQPSQLPQYTQERVIPPPPSYTDWLLAQNLQLRELPGRASEIHRMIKKYDHRDCSQSITKNLLTQTNSSILDQSFQSSQHFKSPTLCHDFALQNPRTQDTLRSSGLSNTSSVPENFRALPNHFYQSSEGCLPITIEYFPPYRNTEPTHHGEVISDQRQDSFQHLFIQEVTDINPRPSPQGQHNTPTPNQTLSECKCTCCSRKKNQEIQNNLNLDQNAYTQETVSGRTICAKNVSTEGNGENPLLCSEPESHVNQSNSLINKRFLPSLKLSPDKETNNKKIATREDNDDTDKSSNGPSTSRATHNPPKMIKKSSNTKAEAEKVLMKEMTDLFKKMHAFTVNTIEMIEKDRNSQIDTVDILEKIMKQLNRYELSANNPNSSTIKDKQLSYKK